MDAEDRVVKQNRLLVAGNGYSLNLRLPRQSSILPANWSNKFDPQSFISVEQVSNDPK